MMLFDSNDEYQQAHDSAKARRLCQSGGKRQLKSLLNLASVEQIGLYIDEHPRSPRLEPWSAWRPTWPRVDIDMLAPDTSTFMVDAIYHVPNLFKRLGTKELFAIPACQLESSRRT